MADITFASSAARRTASLDWAGEILTVYEPNLGPLVFAAESEAAGNLPPAAALRVKLGTFLAADDVARACEAIAAGDIFLADVDDVLAQVVAFFRS